MAYPVNYVKSYAGNLTVIRVDDKLLMRVIESAGTVVYYITSEPDSNSKMAFAKPKQMMFDGNDTVEQVFAKIDAQS